MLGPKLDLFDLFDLFDLQGRDFADASAGETTGVCVFVCVKFEYECVYVCISDYTRIIIIFRCVLMALIYFKKLSFMLTLIVLIFIF